MKHTHILILSGLLLCGCSDQKQASTTSPAMDLVQAGTTTMWAYGKDTSCTLQVAKREGNSLKGIQLIEVTPDGQKKITTAETGALSQGSPKNPADKSCMRLTLYDAKGLIGSRPLFHADWAMFVLNERL